MPKRKVLIVTTSHAELGKTGRRTGVWLEELAAPYYALRKAGAGVTVASIKGGEIPFDPRSTGDEQSDQPVPETGRRFLGDPDATATAKHSPSIDEVNAASFDATFLPGGHGAMWDMPGNPTLAGMVGSLFDTGKIVSAVCHGPAGLVSAKRRNGRSLVEMASASTASRTPRRRLWAWPRSFRFCSKPACANWAAGLRAGQTGSHSRRATVT
jgi:putative intracellular protease/amidase